MDIGKVELQAVERAVVAVEDLQARHLTDLELVLVGGGMGDITLG
jgi:hypothetical protein